TVSRQTTVSKTSNYGPVSARSRVVSDRKTSSRGPGTSSSGTAQRSTPDFSSAVGLCGDTAHMYLQLHHPAGHGANRVRQVRWPAHLDNQVNGVSLKDLPRQAIQQQRPALLEQVMRRSISPGPALQPDLGRVGDHSVSDAAMTLHQHKRVRPRVGQLVAYRRGRW